MIMTETPSSPSLPILRQDNMQMIVQSAPVAYNENSRSAQRCADYGKRLLVDIEQNGMTDELDQRCAEYIDKSRRTLRVMNERRAPFTKLFDQIRSEFTAMENLIDPAKCDTAPYKIQQARNAYAARKREEAERARQEELRRQQREAAIARYRQEVEDDYRRQYDNQVTSDINALTALNQSLTIDNFDEVSAKIKNFNISLGNEWFLQCTASSPHEITEEEASQMRRDILNSLSRQFREQYTFEIGEYRDTILDALPAKKTELLRMAQADAEEQARLQAEFRVRETAEAHRLEEERRRKEEEAAAAKAVRQSAAEMGDLFSQAAASAPAVCQPKVTVKKHIVPLQPDGILAIISMWWSHEGRFLPVEELTKTFKKQITFCDKLANDKNSPEFISSPFIRYEEEVKAK